MGPSQDGCARITTGSLGATKAAVGPALRASAIRRAHSRSSSSAPSRWEKSSGAKAASLRLGLFESNAKADSPNPRSSKARERAICAPRLGSDVASDQTDGKDQELAKGIHVDYRADLLILAGPARR